MCWRKRCPCFACESWWLLFFCQPVHCACVKMTSHVGKHETSYSIPSFLVLTHSSWPDLQWNAAQHINEEKKNNGDTWRTNCAYNCTPGILFWQRCDVAPWIRHIGKLGADRCLVKICFHRRLTFKNIVHILKIMNCKFAFVLFCICTVVYQTEGDEHNHLVSIITG